MGRVFPPESGTTPVPTIRNRLDTVRGMIQELKDLPFAQERTVLFAFEAFPFQMPPSLVAELAKDARPALRAAAVAIKSEQARRAAVDREVAERRAKEQAQALAGSQESPLRPVVSK